MTKKILITGANGFLGSAITKLGLKKGFKVNILIRKDSDTSNLENILSRVNVFYGDLRETDSLDEAIKSSDIIFHVAADYRLWARKPSELYASNVLGTENVARKVLELNKMLIYTSSVATLGITPNKISNEQSETSLCKIDGHYKKSKFLADKIVTNLIKKKKLKAIILNPSTPIGPGDIKPTPTGKIIIDVLRRKMPAYVDTGLNFVHVDDVAEGHFLGLKHGKLGEKYILGGENLELKQFLDIVAEAGKVPKIKLKLKQKYLYLFAYITEIFAKYIFDFNPSLTVDGLRMSEKKMFFSSDKAKKILHYRPRDINNAIKDTIKWIENNRKDL